MFQKSFYNDADRARVTESVRREGFDPICIPDPPGRVYPAHRHGEIKLLVFLQGEIAVNVGKRSYRCRAEDRLIIQGDVEHSAVVGSKGCTFLWSETMENR